jgi:tryptophan oxidase StaO
MDIKRLLEECKHANHQGSKRVTILGAGITGLVAAYEMEKLGHQVDIMEGSPRIGGRIWTHHFGNGDQALYGELGAMRIPSEHEYVLHYIHKLGLSHKLCKFSTIFEEPNALLQIRGSLFHVRDLAVQTLQRHYQGLFFSGRYSKKTLLFAAWLKTVMDAIGSGELRKSLEHDLMTRVLDELEKLDLEPFFSPDGKTIDIHAFFKTHKGFQGLFDQAVGLFINEILVETSPNLLQLEGGMDQLTNRLAAALHGPIRCNQEVVALRVREDGVELSWLEGGRLYTRHCDYVLCTIPYSIVRQMQLSGFDNEKLATIHRTVYWPATKILLHCQHPFWQERGIFGGASFSDEGIRQIYYPSVKGNFSNSSVLLASYTIGNDAKQLERMCEKERYAYVTKALSKIHPEMNTPGMILDGVTMAWGNYKWSMGACAIPWNHGRTYGSHDYIPDIARPQNTLFFAGEHCSRLPAWLQGSIESALQAVYNIVAHKPAINRFPFDACGELENAALYKTPA